MKRYKFPTLLLLCLVVFGMTALGASANTSAKKVTQASPAVSVGRAAATAAITPHVINMQNVPKETSAQAAANATQHSLPLMAGVSQKVYAQRKANAAHANAVKPGTAGMSAPATSGNSATKTPGTINAFVAQSDSAATCPYFGGCQPPDQALAVSFSWVMQGVNTSFAVYNFSGALQTGWPKNAQNFFGVANPGACDPNGPFLSDPRAFYDQNQNRFWVAMLQIEGQIIGNSCPDSTTYWVAVSQTGNPSGAWNVYAFNMAFNTDNIADYTQFGFDQVAVYFSGNMFSQSAGTYQYAEYCGVNKFNMMQGKAATSHCFLNPTLGGVSLDTIQPTLGEALQVGGPLSGQFIASLNIDFGNGQCFSGCSGIVIFAMSNPGASNESVTGAFVSTNGYSLAPAADESGCAGCVDTLDTRISGTPTWHNGLITFGLDTAINNGSQIVSGIFWGQILVNLNDDGTLHSASVYQQGYHFYVGSGSAFFGSLGTDGDGDIIMAFNYSDGTVFPSIAYTSRRVTFAQGAFHDGGLYLAQGAGTYFGGRWGDYSALSPSGVPFTDDIWFAGEFSTAGGDWSTAIGHTKFVRGQN